MKKKLYVDETSEPEHYAILIPETLKPRRIGKKVRKIAFCVNSPGASGYCDDETLWIADQIIDPVRVIEICIHESLHAIFPQLDEREVLKAGLQISKLIRDVFNAKATAPLPSLKPLLTKDNAGKLFPNATPVWPAR